MRYARCTRKLGHPSQLRYYATETEQADARELQEVTEHVRSDEHAGPEPQEISLSDQSELCRVQKPAKYDWLLGEKISCSRCYHEQEFSRITNFSKNHQKIPCRLQGFLRR